MSNGLREQRRLKKNKEKTKRALIGGAVTLLVLVFVGALLWSAVRPAAGMAIPVDDEAVLHAPIGTDPGPYQTDPPTAGRHYPQPLEAGFYEEDSREAQLDYPEGYLLHNLEHGYVVFWYNCEELTDTDCGTLKTQIKGIMDDFNNQKLIGFPRPSMDDPLVITSWGQIQRFETFDEDAARKFIRINRNRAPEPNAP